MEANKLIEALTTIVKEKGDCKIRFGNCVDKGEDVYDIYYNKEENKVVIH